MALASSIFREAPPSVIESLSFTYSADTDSTSCSGIETWISSSSENQRAASPEILWEDQSMRLFRFRQGNNNRGEPTSSRTAATTNAKMAAPTALYPLQKNSMSQEAYKRHVPTQPSSEGYTKNRVGQRQGVGSSTSSNQAIRSASKPCKPRSVSSELASTWLQMGANRQQQQEQGCGFSDVSFAETTESSSSSSCERSMAEGNVATSTTSSSTLGAPRPRWRSTNNSNNSMSVSASRQLGGRKQRYPTGVRDSVQSRVKYSVPATTTNDRSQGHYSTTTRPSSASPTTTPSRPASESSTLRNSKQGYGVPPRPNKSKEVVVPQKSQYSYQAGIGRQNTRSVFRSRGPQEPSSGKAATKQQQCMEPSGKMGDGKTLWRTAEDLNTGRTYYYHIETRETQWRKPLELASDEEKEEMRIKEEKQRNFFSAMEANILKNLQTGAMVAESTRAAEEAKTTATFLQTRNVDGSRSNGNDAERPELIRTISSMDRQVLSELIKRQPSNRRLFDNGDDVSFSTLRSSSITRSLSSKRDGLTEQTKNLSLQDFDVEDEMGRGKNLRNMTEESLDHRESLGTIITNLPEDYEGSSTRMGFSYLDSLGGEISFDGDESQLNVTEDDFEALSQLAQITDQMATLEDSDEDTGDDANNNKGTSSSLPPLGGPSRASVRRASMAEISLDVLEEEKEHSEHSAEEESPRDKAKKERDNALKNVAIGENAGFQKPEMTRRNTCGTMYVGTTMSTPDKDATIKCICGVFRAHILQSETAAAPRDEYLIFNDLESQQRSSKSLLKKIALPSLEEITAFYRDVFRRSQMETDCIIMSLIYVERLIRRTEGRLRPRSSNWRSILFSCMILASKVWDDLSMWNADFSQTCPAGVRFSLQRINELELEVLSALHYDVKVPASEYAKYYFLLRSMLIKSGLGSENQALNPLDVEGAKRLQQMSARYQASQTPSRPAMMRARAKSDANVVRGNGALGARLEHMVEL